jgi:hypothetical protein
MNNNKPFRIRRPGARAPFQLASNINNSSFAGNEDFHKKYRCKKPRGSISEGFNVADEVTRIFAAALRTYVSQPFYASRESRWRTCEHKYALVQMVAESAAVVTNPVFTRK